MSTATPATRAALLVRGASLQGACSGYGLTVTRTELGYDVQHGAGTIYCWGDADAERTVERLLVQRMDAEVVPEQRRLAACGVQL